MTEIELHILVKKDGKLLITSEGIQLLRGIKQSGSLLTASKLSRVSYSKAWNILQGINSMAGSPLVQKSRGGKGGGGAFVTDYGKLVLFEYESMEKVVEAFAKKLNTEINL